MNQDDDADKKMNDMKKELKKRKPKLTVPADFLDNAKSYDDKLMLVKYLTEKEKGRVMLIFKKMISEGIKQTQKKKGLK